MEESSRITKIALNRPQVVMADALLAFSECLENPDRFEQLLGVVGVWLGDGTERYLLPVFESHIAKIWILLSHDANETLQGSSRNGVEEEVVKDGSSFWQDLNAEDHGRLVTWLESAEQSPLALRLYDTHDDRPALGVVLRDKNGAPSLVRTSKPFEAYVLDFLSKSFKLTNSEKSVFEVLIGGHSIAEIARFRERSVETIRSQVKAITAKFGVHSQSDLLRVAHEASVLLPLSQVRDVPIVKRSSGARHIILRDGRTLEYEVDGTADLKPVLLFHCLLAGRHVPEIVPSTFTAQGYQVVRISRSGYGGSTINPKSGTDLLSDHIADCLEVLSAEKITQTLNLCGYGTGYAAAYGLALEYPQLARKVVGINILPPLLTLQDTKVATGMVRTCALSSLYAPNAMKLIARFAAKQLRKRTNFDDRPLMVPDTDYVAREGEDSAKSLHRNLVDVLVNEGECFWREASYYTQDWAFASENANNRPHAVLLDIQDALFTSHGGIEPFSKRIGAKYISMPATQPSFGPMVRQVVKEFDRGPEAP
jgi:pimeloyl-ACP methyl ester carboxylesterase/DNA-binding CsgD family transcriptional regulator